MRWNVYLLKIQEISTSMDRSQKGISWDIYWFSYPVLIKIFTPFAFCSFDNSLVLCVKAYRYSPHKYIAKILVSFVLFYHARIFFTWVMKYISKIISHLCKGVFSFYFSIASCWNYFILFLFFWAISSKTTLYART